MSKRKPSRKQVLRPEAVINTNPDSEQELTAGELVPDELMYGIVADRLREADCKGGFVLDGFPRTAAQAGWLDAFLEKEVFDKSEKCPPVVIQLLVDYTQLLLRLTGRRSCPTCGRLYNIHFQPPLVDELCDWTDPSW